MIKHISFDVWNTLITANPEFANARRAMIASVTGAEQDVVKSVYTAIKQKADKYAEKCGVAFTTEQLISELVLKLTGRHNEASVEVIKNEITHLFIKHPPVLPRGTRARLDQVYDLGISLSIASNSNFISGSVMYPWLCSHLPLAFGVFSDLEGTSKPSATFFGKVIDAARTARGWQEIDVNEILHVGDNPICDGWGATQLGLNVLMINHPEELRDALKREINIHL